MPELPELERFKWTAEKALNVPVRSARVLRPRQLTGVSPSRFETLVRGKKLTEARRHGKNLFLKLSAGPWLALHFGLSGSLRIVKSGSAAKGGTLIFELEDGRNLVYSALFGKVSVTPDPGAFVKETGLGPDALDMTFTTFEKIARSGGGDVKGLLMDQRRIAGVGNMYSDEALFIARVHPKTRIEAMGAGSLRAVYDANRRVLKEMVKTRREGEGNFPEGYFAHLRETGGRCPRCGALAKTLAHGGRKAHYCPKCQPLKP
jgi:formamidopyrimidine-DNA glycosylase